jgi:hypothetical protein
MVSVSVVDQLWSSQYVIFDADSIASLYRYILQFQNSTLDEIKIGYPTKMSKTDINRIRSAYRCDAQGEGARQPTATNGKLKKAKTTQGQKKTGQLSRVAELTLY